MSFVVDASVAGSWFLPDESHPEAITALDRLHLPLLTFDHQLATAVEQLGLKS